MSISRCTIHWIPDIVRIIVFMLCYLGCCVVVLENHTTIKHVWSLECTVDLYMEVIAGRNYRLAVDKINLVIM